jgi:CheY-like chemotaxis protein
VDSEPVTVLVADDEEDMRVLVRAILAKSNVEVVAEAIDGQEALDTIARLDPPPVPTALILDNRMPGLSGLDVAAQVLARTPGQPIVLFSAYLTREIEQQARAMGIRACVSKTDIARLPGVIADLAASA